MYKKMLVPLDGSALAESVLPHVVAIAKAFNIADVWLLGVIEPIEFHAVEPFSWADIENLRKQHEKTVEEYIKHIAQRLEKEGVAVKSSVEEGAVAESILKFTESRGIDLIVMATHGRSGIGRWVYGSVADKVLRAAKTPVLLVRSNAST